MKSRVAITAILMLGLVTGGTGTTLAVSGGSGSAAQVQYPRDVQPNQPGNQGPAQNQSSPDNVLGATEEREGGQVLGRTQSGGGAPAVQGAPQAVATEGGSELPFTGLAAVPLIVLGLGLIATGAMLYRSARRAPSEA